MRATPRGGGAQRHCASAGTSSRCDPDFLVWCMLMYEAGLRMGEAFGRQWGDIVTG